MYEKKGMPAEGFFHPTEKPFEIERKRVDTPWSMQKYHYHDCIEFYYLVRGSRYYFIKDKTYRVNAGELVTVAPYDIHATAATEEGAYERVLITVKKEFLSPYYDIFGADIFKFLNEGSRIVEFSPKERERVEELLDALLEESSSLQENSDAVVKNALIGLLLRIGRKRERAENIQVKMPQGALLVSRVSGYISGNFEKKITLTDLAAEFFVSPSYLSRTFTRITGMTLTDHINAVRIKEARRLLLTTEMTVASVAERVGFSSLTHFERVFKSLVRARPLDFRTKKLKR